MLETNTVLPVSHFESSTASYTKDAKMQAELNLVHLTHQGDVDAFNQLVLTYQDLVYRQAYWILGQEEAAEDAAQETFYRAFQKIHTFKGSSFRAWILRIATNHCLDQIRRRKCHPVFPLNKIFEDTQEEDENSSWLVDPDPSPEQIAEQAELDGMITQCLMKLPPIYRLPIILSEIQEMNYQEAAQVIGLRLGTFKSRLFRARMQFIEAINRIPEFDRLAM
jgi:RNA polymerase sigma-70 factor (ECF subfamily)